VADLIVSTRPDVHRSLAVRYSAALVFTAAALAANLLLHDISPSNRYFLFACAVLASSLYGGFGPGVLTTFLMAVASSLLFSTPVASFSAIRQQDVERLAFVITEGLVISGVGHMTWLAPPTRNQPVLVRYGFAVMIAIGIAALKFVAFPMIASRVPFAFCYAIAIATAWAGGFGPSMAANSVSALAGFRFMQPFEPTTAEERVMMFVLEATLLSLLTGSYRALLLQTEAFLARLFFDSPAGILVVRPDLYVAKANPAIRSMLARRQNGLEGTGLAELLHPSSREWLLASLHRLNRGSQPIMVHDVRFIRNGRDLWAELQAARIELPGERDLGWLLTIEDVTDRE
jgi:PAS domain S-box-containing protein